MLYFLFIWVILLVGCASIGIALLARLSATSLERSHDHWMISLWLGLITLAVSFLAASLVIPLSPWVGAIVFGSLIALSLRSKLTRAELRHIASNLNKAVILRFFGVAIVVAAITSQPITWVDTGFYHYGIIQWLAQYGTVPGLALLYSPLGFTSAWFALAAPLNPSFFEARLSAAANGFAALIFVLHVWSCLTQIRQRQGTIGDWFIVITGLFLLPLFLLSKTLQAILVSPSPDLPVVFLIIIAAWSMLIVGDRRSRLIPLILASGAVTIKLTALPLLMTSSLFFVIGTRRIQQWLIGMAIVSVILAPLFVSSILTSGCPLYPSTTICFDLPWSPSSSALQQVANSTHRWVSWYGTQPAELNEWLALIWAWLNTARRNQIVVALSVVSVLCLGYFAKHLATFPGQGQFWAIATGLSGIGFLTLTSPLLRFQLAYMILIPGLLMAHYCTAIFRKRISGKPGRNNLVAKRFYLPFSVRLLTLSLMLVVVIQTHAISHIVLPPRLPNVGVVQKQVNDFVYFYPSNAKNRMCWAAPLPCSSIPPTNIRIRDRDQGIKGGLIRLQSQF
ncbi:hypothetical protein [Leptolyngbya sp. FACHB-17]|uniref:LIC_10190 family membrane protein n=1 Tax=unclassified Leptolyngbya TaxID=2650499 RepID=UPI0016800D75|nr:hypothetical protein [Leptolyngbya sp. FACHB-17]MBD2081291.1 hypothetical protein [Leptolyngbya sp. FACHB-17]